MTKEQMLERKEEIRLLNPVPDVLKKHGISIRSGRCIPICHNSKRYNAKVSSDLYFCFVCDKKMDVFDIEQILSGCDFKTAFSLLGGDENPSPTTKVKAKQVRNRRENEQKRLLAVKSKLKEIVFEIAAYRALINDLDPFCDLWCYCQNKLAYKLYEKKFYEEAAEWNL